MGCRLGCRIKAKCPLVGPGPVGGVPFLEVFLSDLRPYLSEAGGDGILRRCRALFDSSL